MSVRITNNMMHDNFMRNYHTSLKRMTKHQYQMSSNKRILRLSDDPIGVLSSMNARVRIYSTERYQNSVEKGKTWLEQGETSLLDINELIKETYANAIDAATDVKNETDRQAIAEVVGQYRDHLLQTLNSTYGDKYLFGGYNQTTAPFKVDETTGDLIYNGINLNTATDADLELLKGDDIFELEVGYGIRLDVAIPGYKITGTGPNNLYSVFNDLYNKLVDPNATPDDIMQEAKRLQEAQSHVMATDASVGGRVNRLELLEARYKTDHLNYTEIKSNIEDADLAEVSMNFMMAQYVYQSALSVGAKILQPSLVSFL